MPPKGKQGTKGQKQILEENKSTLNFYRMIIAAVNVVYFGITYMFFWEQFTTLPITMSLLSAAIYFGSYQFMASMGRATYSPDGALLDSGIDLNMESGMAEHSKDIILLTAIVQTFSVMTNFFWLFLLLAPGRAFYMLWVNILGPWFFAEAPEQQVDDKKQKKMERKMKRMQR